MARPPSPPPPPAPLGQSTQQQQQQSGPASASSPKQHQPSPRKRKLPADACTAVEPSNASIPTQSPSIRALHRQQLATVVKSLAPRVVLEQHLTVPGAPSALLEALADSAPLLPLSVLRACVNEACTSALLSSAMALDAPSEQDSATLLNDVDRFQEAILAVLDELEGTYRRQEANANGGKMAAKREEDAEDVPPPSKVRRYMLHRTLGNGDDVFTSAAVLSDADLEALSKLDDTDVIAVHPPPTASTSYALDPFLSQSESEQDLVPVPALGEVTPRPFGWQSARHVAPVARVGAAPGLYGAEAALRKDPNFLDPLNPTRRPTVLLSYDSPFLSSLAPTHDSTGATEPYSRSASRALSQLRNRRWIDAALGKEEEEEAAIVLSEQESETLRSLGIDIEALLAGPNPQSHQSATSNGARAPRPRARKPLVEASTSSRDAETAVWTRLEENAELIVRVARAQVARARDSYDEELRRLKRRAEKAAKIANRPVPATGGAAVKEEEKDAASAVEETSGEKAGRAELEDAKALLDSLVSLISSMSTDATSNSTSVGQTSPRIVPPPALLAKLAPLLVASRAKEPSYHGTLDPINDRAVKMRESVLPIMTSEMDLDVKV